MGWGLIILGVISAFYKVVMIFQFNQVQKIVLEENTQLTFFAQYYWLPMVIFIIIDILVILFGSFLNKHPELNKKYLALSIAIIIFLLIAAPILMMLSIQPLMNSIFNMSFE